MASASASASVSTEFEGQGGDWDELDSRPEADVRAQIDADNAISIDEADATRNALDRTKQVFRMQTLASFIVAFCIVFSLCELSLKSMVVLFAVAVSQKIVEYLASHSIVWDALVHQHQQDHHRITALQDQVRELQTTVRRLAYLADVGAAVRIRFLEHAKLTLHQRGMSKKLFVSGNNIRAGCEAAHDANALADSVLQIRIGDWDPYVPNGMLGDILKKVYPLAKWGKRDRLIEQLEQDTSDSMRRLLDHHGTLRTLNQTAFNLDTALQKKALEICLQEKKNEENSRSRASGSVLYEVPDDEMATLDDLMANIRVTDWIGYKSVEE